MLQLQRLAQFPLAVMKGSYIINTRSPLQIVAGAVGRACRLHTSQDIKVTPGRLLHTGPAVEVPEMSLTKYVFQNAGKYGQAVAIVDGTTGKTITYDQLQEDVDHVTRSLHAKGVGHGDTVTLFATNNPYFAHVVFGVTECGAAVSLANHQLKAVELKDQLQASKSCLVMASPDCADTALEAVHLAGGVQEVIVLGEQIGCLPFHELVRSGQHQPRLVSGSSDVDRVALLPFSSGTTSLPKGVVLTHRNLVAQVAAEKHPWFLPMTPGEDIALSALPLVHLAGLIFALCTPLSQGACMVTVPRFEPLTLLQTIEKHKVTFCVIAPPIMAFLAKDPRVTEYDLSTLHKLLCLGSSLSATLTQSVVDRLGLPGVYQAYGMSETGPTICSPTLPYCTYGSIGVPMPNISSKVIDTETGQELGANKTGEVMVKGPQVTVGYLNNPQATQDTFTDDGYVKSGDLGFYDEQGQYFIVDRLKDIINYKGLQISPGWLESVLMEHPSVREAAVVGVPAGEDVGELATAWVVLKDPCSTEQLMEHVNARVAPYKRLRGGIEVVTTIPKNPSGKILRRHILQCILERPRHNTQN